MKEDFRSASASTTLMELEENQYSNVLDVTGKPDPVMYGERDTNIYNHFSDNGAWHAYYLHKQEDTALYGGFAGPLIIAEEYPVNLSDSLSRIVLRDGNGERYDLSKAQVIVRSYPGKLAQLYRMPEFDLMLELIFASSRSALIRTVITNKTRNVRSLKLGWEGSIFTTYFTPFRVDGPGYLPLGDSLSAEKDGIGVSFETIREIWNYKTTVENKFSIVHDVAVNVEITGDSYTLAAQKPILIEPGKQFVTYETQSFTFTKAEAGIEELEIQRILAGGDSCFKENSKRWESYIETIEERAAEQKYKNAAVKSIQTLMTNWRSPAGALKHDGVVPSTSFKWFGGLWAWDTWKQAVGIAGFNGELAMDSIRSLFDYQITGNDPIRPQDAGTIIDCIFYNRDPARGGDSRGWNERNSKPALAAWAVYNVYQKTKNLDFLCEMYPKLTAYHNWWYTNRDVDHNGIAEYGGMVHDLHYTSDDNGNPVINPNMVIETAAWESGMDNATRFDVQGSGENDIGVLVYENKNAAGEIVGYSINQESVDLNSYLYAEKGFLKSMAEILGHADDVAKYEKEAAFVKEYINQNMFDEVTGFYYDLQITADGSKKMLLSNRGKGPEGWLPLWAKLATKDKAERVIQNMMDPEVFNLPMPFPTAAKDNSKFDPNQYWRGPVWMDQALYGVEALQNYDHYNDAKTCAYKLFDNAEGLLACGSIRENYNPITGGGLHTKNFSWSAAAYYLLYQNTLTGNRTTSQIGMLPDI